MTHALAHSADTAATAPPSLLSIAPMMDRTDRHFRFFARQIARRPLLYTEMVTTAAILHGDREQLLGYDPAEHPVALQIGGDNPTALAQCTRIGEQLGYDEINLNVGCPSDRVQQGSFGACLMARPTLVAECVAAMIRAARVPVTVKHRIGIDGLDRYEDLAQFLRTVAQAGCARFIVHARIAVLSGLSPKQNRIVPPLRHDWVHRLKQDFPRLTIDLNGGITDLAQATEQLQRVDGVMIGRAAYDDPYLLAEADRRFWGAPGSPPTRAQIIEAMIPYVERWHHRGVPPLRITRHMLGLLRGQPGARAWRRCLTHIGGDSQPSADALRALLRELPPEVLHSSPRFFTDTTSARSACPRSLS